MPRPKKKLPPVRVQKDILLEIIASNIRELMNRKWAGQATTETKKIAALSGLSGVGKETIRKILVREQSPRVDNLHSIAMALGTSAAALLQSQTPITKDLPPEDMPRERISAPRGQELLHRR